METVIALLLIVVALGLAAKGGNRRRRRSYVSYSGSNDDVTILGAGIRSPIITTTVAITASSSRSRRARA